MLIRPILCLIVDPALPDVEKKLDLALSAGVNMVHIRTHQLTPRQFYEAALRLAAVCRNYQVCCIVNDRLDVGIAIQADGYQLGQQSLPLWVARRIVGTKPLLGASVHSLEEAAIAIQENAHWLLAGTIFPSTSHPGLPGQGISFIQNLKDIYPSVSVIAIGGINVNNVAKVMRAGADGVAVISAILGASNVEYATKILHDAIVGSFKKERL